MRFSSAIKDCIKVTPAFSISSNLIEIISYHMQVYGRSVGLGKYVHRKPEGHYPELRQNLVSGSTLTFLKTGILEDAANSHFSTGHIATTLPQSARQNLD